MGDGTGEDGPRMLGIGRTHKTSIPCRAILAAALVLPLAAGCVERRMTIRSHPSGALVTLDGQEIGFAPVSVPFTYYGDRQIKLIKDGYETKTINQTVSTPWYEYPPLDFVAEVLIPWRIRDERNYLYTLEPQMMVSSDQLLERAARVREEGRNPPSEVLERAGVAAPIPPGGVPIDPLAP